MMKSPIALQLYTLREAAQKDYAAVVTKVAEIGYVGVETAGFPGTTAAGAARLYESLGLEVTSAHAPLPLGDKKSEVLETMDALGCDHLVCPWMDPKNYASVDAIKRVGPRWRASIRPRS
jgi:sugar phosphate isomerase/epimerase